MGLRRGATSSVVRVVAIVFVMVSLYALYVALDEQAREERLRSLEAFVTDSYRTVFSKAECQEVQAETSNGTDMCVDGYRRSGYLFIPSEEQYTRTRYIPFYESQFQIAGESEDDSDPPYARYPSAKDPELVETGIETDFMAMAPHSWMWDLNAYYEFVNKSEETTAPAQRVYNRLDWLRNKRILLMGDSVDRYMMIYLCNELGKQGNAEPMGRHVWAYCKLPELNLTINHWHVASLYTTRPSWWWQPKMEFVPFEERFEKLFKSTLPEVIGSNGRSPDLVMYQSGLWDQVTFTKYFQAVKNKGLSTGDRQASWQELRFFMARMRQLIEHTRGIFGEDVPMLYRTLTLHKSVGAKDLFLEDLDRGARYVSAESGVEMFEWGKLVTGFSSLYVDEVHPKRGPMSWLYGNMLLSYLFRASGGIEYEGQIVQWPRESTFGSAAEAWEQCHSAYIDHSIR
ncbi:uncharacterized protein V1510DRAFT_410277 [Dipodascopsis tothii]|uniref:uncharacterized protein n=1 Tax=Dipodascopsis tothii TaxID=44089 RepID=UPI0034CDEB41